MATSAAVAPTVYIRCAALHSRGELLNSFFYAHRVALGIECWYEEASDRVSENPEEPPQSDAFDAAARPVSAVAATPSPRLPAHSPIEVVYVRTSRKPYFLVEWRYPTKEEKEKKKAVDADGLEGTNDESESVVRKETPVPLEAPSSSHASPVSDDVLLQVAERALSLGKPDSPDKTVKVEWKGQPVFISAAMPGMSVAAERQKLELRDAQLKVQRATEKRHREEVEGKAEGVARVAGETKAAAAFVPRSVRRRA